MFTQTELGMGKLGEQPETDIMERVACLKWRYAAYIARQESVRE